MRITSGILGGRKVSVPKVAVRPTQERVREALFSSLSERIVGARFLDLCAGSGAVGIEAWSRGAAHICWVEKDRRVFHQLKKNVESLRKNGPTGVTDFINQDAVDYVKRAYQKFDVIYVDPPYDEPLFEPIIDAAPEFLAEGGLLMYEVRAHKKVVAQQREWLEAHPQWTVVREKKYGEAYLFCLEAKPAPIASDTI